MSFMELFSLLLSSLHPLHYFLSRLDQLKLRVYCGYKVLSSLLLGLFWVLPLQYNARNNAIGVTINTVSLGKGLKACTRVGMVF